MKKTYAVATGAFQPTRLLFEGQDVGLVSEWYFDPPAEDKVGTLLNERKANEWRTPLGSVSAAAWPKDEEEWLTGPNGEKLRMIHNVLVANSFALHPMFGTGHVLRTDGRVAAFWNGEICRVVRLTNLKMLRVVLSTTEKQPREAGQGRKPKAKKNIDLAMELLFEKKE